MTRKRLLAAAAGLAALAVKPRLEAQEAQEGKDGESRLESVDKRLAAIERALLDRSVADATPAARALDTRLTRIEMRLDRMERDIWDLRNRVGR
jgi:septal ring factor EnvC (AmiA/AmiB activator)